MLHTDAAFAMLSIMMNAMITDIAHRISWLCRLGRSVVMTTLTDFVSIGNGIMNSKREKAVVAAVG